jgi:hypothetical protein
MESHSLSRQELFDLVWSEPRERIAARLKGISPAIITRTCEDVNIPLPGRGYWAKLEAGQKIQCPAMPLRWPGQDEFVQLESRGGRRYGPSGSPSDEQLLLAAPPKPPVFVEDTEAVITAAVALLRPIRVRRDLSLPHVEVRKLLAAEERRRQKALKWGSSWDCPRYQGEFFQRQLRIFNALFLGLAPIGKATSIGEEAQFERGVGTGYVLTATVRIGAINLGLTFPMERVVPPKEAEQYKPKSPVRLVLKAWQRDHDEVVWQDEPQLPLEKQLDEVVRTLLVQSELRRRAHAQWLYEWELERIQEARKRRAERDVKAEKARIEILLAMADKLEQAERVRRLADAFASAGSAPAGYTLDEWLALAHRVADDLDPRSSSQTHG